MKVYSVIEIPQYAPDRVLAVCSSMEIAKDLLSKYVAEEPHDEKFHLNEQGTSAQSKWYDICIFENETDVLL